MLNENLQRQQDGAVLTAGGRSAFRKKRTTDFTKFRCRAGRGQESTLKSTFACSYARRDISPVSIKVMDDYWPFDQSKNVAALTTRQVLREGHPILRVVHYSDDHSWAFTCGTTSDPNDLLVVSMKRVVELDPTIFSIADLLPGWGASRKATGSPWERYQRDDEG